MPHSDDVDARKRARLPPGAPDFSAFIPPGFEREFERMRGEMERMVEEMMRGMPAGFMPPAFDPSKAKPGEPFVYGFSFRMGPDGKPQFQEFGNPRPLTPAAQEGAREPLTDVVAGEREVAVTIELPGASKEDLSLHVSDDRLTVRVDGGRRYYKEIALPARVVPKTANATFKNGILDITIERESPARDPGFKVDVR